eukprot:gnl/TRDRNA2_/TRDRNA2_176743_c0_seq2.p1 gnl/TRDRNA2_/TRDRNA2_176743_c0~~gnl/TRDRNA2_/TRDRNA2_176743_c0_seq2.p1  ORF type:complete len:479 (-),score=77.54 gnl/TRDRNA2_/TRDRNA2_176743_c0_seq2:685-2070(-)
MEVQDMVRYLGMNAQMDRVQELIMGVDHHTDGRLDRTEFVRLMRSLREEEMSRCREVFEAHAEQAWTGILPKEKLKAAVEALGQKMPPEMEVECDRLSGAQASFDFDAFIDVSDRCRKLTVENKRKHAAFEEEEVQLVHDLYCKHGKDTVGGVGPLKQGQLIFLLMELNVPLHTNESRQQIFYNLKEARTAAARTGISPDQLGQGDQSTTFLDLLYLLREMIRSGEETRCRREEQAIAETRFSIAEVSEFRKVFIEWTERATDQNGLRSASEEGLALVHESGRRSSAPEISAARTQGASATVPSAPAKKVSSRRCSMPELGAAASEATDAPVQAQSGSSSIEVSTATLMQGKVSRMGLDGVICLLAFLGVPISGKGHEELVNKVNSLNEADPRGLDFPDFLRLMHWLLDCNFCGINSAAARRVETLKHGDAVAAPRFTLPSLAVKLDRPLAGTTGRRRSVG